MPPLGSVDICQGEKSWETLTKSNQKKYFLMDRNCQKKKKKKKPFTTKIWHDFLFYFVILFVANTDAIGLFRFKCSSIFSTLKTTPSWDCKKQPFKTGHPSILNFSPSLFWSPFRNLVSFSVVFNCWHLFRENYIK